MTHYDDPQIFTAGTVGEPGARTFYLQAVHHGEVTSVKVEKQQVVALIEYLDGLLDDLPAPRPVIAAPDLTDPGEPDWVVGTIGVAYDNDRDRVVVVAGELVPDGDEGRELQVAVTREQIRALIDRAEIAVAGGRPPCCLCGAPVDPSGHACPRAN